MKQYICIHCGQPFSAKEEVAHPVCPDCASVQAQPVSPSEDLHTDFSAGGQLTAEQAASLDEFRAVFSSGAKERGFSVAKMKSSISDENADIPDYIVPEEPEDDGRSESDDIFYRHEAQPDPEPTKRQIRKAERFARRDEKIRKRNEKIIEKYKKSTNRPLIFFAILLLILIGILSLMYYNGLSFFDLPDFISDLRNGTAGTPASHSALSAGSGSENASDPALFSDASDNTSPLPAAGVYTVTAGEGVTLRMAASSAAEALATVPYGVTVNATAFSFDGENQVYWARVTYDGHIGWVIADALERSLDADTPIG